MRLYGNVIMTANNVVREEAKRIDVDRLLSLIWRDQGVNRRLNRKKVECIKMACK